MTPRQLPPKTRCTVCQKLQAIASYSKKQQDRLRSGLASGRVRSTEEAAGEWIVCENCTDRSRSELKCSLCYTVKGLDGFSKAQRRNNDNAVNPEIFPEENLTG